MSLRPIQDLNNSQAMEKLGRLSALRSHRADALHMMRDAVVRLQNASSIDSVELGTIELCVKRLREIELLQSSVAAP